MNLNPEKVFAALGGMLLLAGLAYHQVRDKAPLDDELLIGTALDQNQETVEKAPEKGEIITARPNGAREDCEKRDDGQIMKNGREAHQDCAEDSVSG
jgi:hypothetical protein